MLINEIINKISWQECAAVIFSIIQVLLAYRNNPVNYLFGICGIILTIIVLTQTGLYAEVSVNVYYFIMSVYGWINWRTSKDNKALEISFSSKKDHFISITITALSFLLIFGIISTFAYSEFAVWDSLVAAFAYGGMYLMSQRKIENWIYLNISNAIAIPLLFFKDLYLFVILTIVLFIVAIFGYFRWKKSLNPRS